MFSDIWLSNPQDRNAANFPRAILSVSRQECDRLPLTIKRGLSDDPGQLPDDWQGRLFVISPVGDLDSDTIGDTPVVLPSANGWTPLFNGDGMVYRLDFDSPGATWSAKIVKTPCYYADRATDNLQQLPGVVCGPMDESCFGYHLIDVKTGHVESDYAADREYTWAAAFYVYRDDRPTSQFDTLYWNSWGCWSDILSQHVFDLYRDYQPRRVPIEEVLKLTRSGIPANLYQLKIDRKTKDRVRRLTLGDRYQFPPGYLGTSAQFIPKAGQSGATAGYIICVVIHSDALLSTDENAPDWSLKGRGAIWW